MGMRVASAVRMSVFVFVKDNLKLSAKYVRDPAKRPQTGDMRAAF